MTSELRQSRLARRILLRLGLVCFCAGLLPTGAPGDAIIRTQAMLASTIAELFVEESRVYVELEIGLSDLEAFHNLLPDEIYEKLGNPPLPLGERLPRFFGEDLAIAGDDGEPLPGHILDIRPRPRVRRDEITGEPLAQSQEEELVIFARLEYALSGEPSTLTFLGPPGGNRASIGFVAYHHGIPVNDFRYMGPVQTLELDWQDPWYTRFRSRNLRRTYFAPMSGFIYVEPYEVRKEIIVRPRDLQHWIDLGLADRKTIPVELQADLKRKVAEFLRQHHPVQIDGQTIEPELARINFLERTVRTSRIVDPPSELSAYSAILGIIFVYPTDGLPERVTMDWDLWSPRIQRIPGLLGGPGRPAAHHPGAGLSHAGVAQLPQEPGLADARGARPTAERAGTMDTNRALGRAGDRRHRAGTVGKEPPAVARRHRSRSAGDHCGHLLGEPRLGLTDARTREVVSGLLHNVYRAFDFRQEEQIYDVLAKTVQGELLEQIYLETRRGLELASQGGARVKVKEIALVELTAESADGGGFVATVTWNAAGSVGHWGHVHQRQNQYQAELRVRPIAGVWKLMEMEILQEERL